MKRTEQIWHSIRCWNPLTPRLCVFINGLNQIKIEEGDHREITAPFKNRRTARAYGSLIWDEKIEAEALMA